MVDYISGHNAADLFVPAKAAVVYAAHEQSLFLSGELIPVVNAPNGVLQVPTIAKAGATTVSAEGVTNDIANVLPTIASKSIEANLIAARSVVRDLGNIDPNEIGRSLGMSVASAFDAAVVDKMGDLTKQEKAGAAASGVLTITDIAEAVETIRGQGETGQLFGIISTTEYAQLMTGTGGIGTSAFAGGDLFQGQALRSGFFGNIFGVQLFVSSYLKGANMAGETNPLAAIFSADAMRIAMQKNVDLEIARRAEAVGNDIVASLHAGVDVVDANRGVLILNDAA